VGVGVGVGLSETLPVQVTPLRAKSAGVALEPFQVPLKPKLAVPPLGMAAL
jgi:hypothetical protein